MYEQLMRELAEYAGSEGLVPSDLLGLPDGLRGLVTWLTRHGEASAASLASHLGCEPVACAKLASLLVARGLLSVDEAGLYRARMTGRRPRPSSDRLRKLFEDEREETS